MRIGIDVRYLSHGLIGGVHTYVASLTPALLRAAPGDEFFLYADTKSTFEMDDLPANARVRRLAYRSPLSSVAIDLRLRAQMAADHVDVAHFPANYGFGPSGARTVITLHDEINILPLREILRGHRKAARTMAMMIYLHAMTTAAVRRADCILTDSEHARRRIVEVGSLPPGRVVTVHAAPPSGTARIEEPSRLAETRAHYSLHGRFVLADALKNPGALLRAWQLLAPDARNGVEIVFFSRTPDLPLEVKAAEARYEARVLIRPTRAELLDLYSLCEVFVFPSWIEGFGLPVLEAMACGAPVIASNRGSLPEIVGGAGLMCEANDAAALADHLTAVLGTPDVARSLRRKGLERAAHFSWERTAQLVLDVYRSIPTTRLQTVESLP